MAPHLSGTELDQIQKLKNQPTTKILERLTKAREMVYLAISGLISALSSALFGFVDDIVMRVQHADGLDVRVGEIADEVKTKFRVQIDLRSASRVGESDLGANAQRIKEFGILLMK